MPPIVRDELPRTDHFAEFVGAHHGQVPLSLILVHAASAAGPAVHRHPEPEALVVESGEGVPAGRRDVRRTGR